MPVVVLVLLPALTSVFMPMLIWVLPLLVALAAAPALASPLTLLLELVLIYFPELQGDSP